MTLSKYLYSKRRKRRWEMEQEIKIKEGRICWVCACFLIDFALSLKPIYLPPASDHHHHHHH